MGLLMFPSIVKGYRIAQLQTLSEKMVYAHPDVTMEPYLFRLSEETPDPMPLSKAVRLLEKCHQWALANMADGPKTRQMPYFKFMVLAVDAEGDVAYGWLPFAVATPNGDKSAAGLPIREYGGQTWLEDAPDWYAAYNASGAHVVGTFETHERKARLAARAKLAARVKRLR